MSRKLLCLALLLPSAVLAGCGYSKQKGAEAPPPKVEVAEPVTQEVIAYEYFTGRTDARRSIDVRARVTGYLVKVNFKEGADVNQGDPLFEIDPRPYKAEMDRAEANLALANAHQKRLEDDYRRAQPLVNKGAMSPEEFNKIAGDLSEAEASVGVAKAQVESARLNLNFTQIKATMSGRISRQNIDPDNLVVADNTVLTTIVTLDPIYAYFDVDERTMLRIRKLIREGKASSARDTRVPLDMGTSDEEGYPHQGFINFVDNKLDPGTGTLRVRGEFDNPDKILAPGLFARLRIPIGKPHQALCVAERALGTDQGQKYVFVVGADGKVEQRPVKIGTLQEGLREVLEAKKNDKGEVVEGLQEGEKVVVSGLQRVRKGVEVEATTVDMKKVAGGNKVAVITNQHEGGGGAAVNKKAAP